MKSPDVAYFQRVFDHAPDMFVSVCITTSKIDFCNKAVCQRLAWARSQLIDANVYSIFHADCHAEVKRVLRDIANSGHARSDALLLLTRHWEGLPVSLRVASEHDQDGRVVRCHMYCREIEADHKLDQLRLDLRLQASQKTESVALLTSSVAHDFNNLLVTIIGNAEIGSRQVPHNSLALAKFNDISAAASQAASLTRQLMDYSRTRLEAKRRFDLNTTVSEMTHLLAVAISHKVRLTYALSSTPVTMWGDQSSIQHVIMNLLTNSAEAVDAVRGAIVVRSGVETLDRDTLITTALGACLRAGDYAFLEVTDNGIGLSDAQIARMFDPFYTTKEDGHGLGLAAVLGIVRAHAGTLRVKSRPGHGTSIKLYFPFKADTDQPASSESRPGGPRHEHVLLVDDEQQLRGLARRILENEGFAVTECEDGQQAVEMYDVIGHSVDVVLMDVRMPRCDGMTAYRTLRERSDDQSVVLMSGRVAPPREVIRDDHALRFLEKPFNHQALVDTVVAAIERA